MNKTKIFIAALLCVIGIGLISNYESSKAAKLPDNLSQYYTLFNGETFTKSATVTDTTGWYNIAGAREIDVSYFYDNSASSTITLYAIGKYGSNSKLIWSGTAITKPFDSTLGVGTARLRMADSNKIGTPTHIKLAVTVIGSSDSSNLLKYYGYMEAR
jgi:hypothetical protein